MKKNFKIKKPVIYALITLALLSLYLYTRPLPAAPERKTYNEFAQMMKDGTVETVSIDTKQSSFNFWTKDGKYYVTENPKVDGFKESMLLADIDVREVAPTDTSEYFSGIMSLGLICVLLYLIKGMGRSGKPQEISTENGNVPTVKFDDIVANEDFINEIKQFVDFLKEPAKYHEMGAKMPKGLIFYGPPGTGKTLTARAIAGEAGVPFYSVSGSDFVEMYVGVGAMRVRKLFKEARKKKNCIIFIDELDAVGGRRGLDSNSESRQTINALLSEMDGFNTDAGILVIGATNKFEDLDSALTRAGRFDRHIAVPLPETKKEREDLFKLYTKNIKLSDDIDLVMLSKETIGFSPATIASLVNDSVLVALAENSQVVNQKHFEKAMFRRLTSGHEKTNHGKLSKEDIQIIAYHEAGHALASKLLTNQTVSKVTIMGSTSGVGGATFILPEKMGLHSENDLRNRIMVSYGGRVAEELLHQDKRMITSGASQDLKTISEILKVMYSQYGMMGIGLNKEVFKTIDKEDMEYINKYATNCYSEVQALIEANRGKLDAIAQLLIEKETIYEKELDAIINN